DLVLSGVHLEPRVVREGGIEQSERMRELQLFEQVKFVPVAKAEAAGCPLAYTIDGQHGGGIVRRREERARRVRLVVLSEQYPSSKSAGPGDVLAHPQLLSKPQWHRLQEGVNSRRSEIEIGLQQPVELL